MYKKWTPEELAAPSKVCTQCGQDKLKSEFVRNSRNKDGLANLCKSCKVAQRPKVPVDSRIKYTPEVVESRTKFCAKCGETKPKSEFWASKANADGLVTTCKACRRTYKREKYASDENYRERAKAYARTRVPLNVERQRANPEKHREAQLKHRYGVTASEYATLAATQNGECAICRTTNPGTARTYFCVDHNHRTGTLRGLLCERCNIALGNVNDSIQTIEKLRRYKRYSSTSDVWDSLELLESAIAYLKNPPAAKVLK